MLPRATTQAEKYARHAAMKNAEQSDALRGAKAHGLGCMQAQSQAEGEREGMAVAEALFSDDLPDGVHRVAENESRIVDDKVGQPQQEEDDGNDDDDPHVDALVGCGLGRICVGGCAVRSGEETVEGQAVEKQQGEHEKEGDGIEG